MNFSRVDTQKTEDNSDCRTLAPFVMTLFDGEADELESRRARAHLLVCQSCAMRWLDWNRSRDLLQSAPVPAPPPQLLWRVLMACRLANASKRGSARQNHAENETEVGPSGDFTAQILARTTRQAPANRQAPAKKSAQVPGFVNYFAPRRLSALAVPALALWMMVLQRDAWLPTPIPVSAPTTASRLRLPAPAASRRAAALPRLALKPLATSRNDLADAGEAPPRDAISRTGANSPHKTRLANSRFEARATAANVEISLPVTSARRALATPLVSDVATPRLVSKVEVMDSSRAPVRPAPVRFSPVRLARFSSQRATPRLRAARWRVASLPAQADSMEIEQESQNSDFAASRQVLRVSLPTVSLAARAMLSTGAPAILLAENFESDDERVEEIRSVVDDFRATLGPDESANAEADDEDSTG